MDRTSTKADTNIMAAFGPNLKAARVSAGLTWQELAASASIALTIPAQIEIGYGDPGLRRIGILANAVRCAAYHLVYN